MIGLLAKLLADIKALADRLTSPWAAKLDALHTLLGSAWAAQLDADVSSRADASDYTANRAAKLDYLDASILSRASSADWTSNRAGKIDYLDASISAISVIKSIQTGKVDTSTVSSGSTDELRYIDVSITSVTTSKAVVLHQVAHGTDGDSAAEALDMARAGVGFSDVIMARAYLTSSTNLRIYSGRSATHNAFSGRWWVVEFK